MVIPMASAETDKSPIQYLLTVSRIVRDHGGEEVNRWLSKGLDRVLFHGEDLGRALGLNSRGVGREAEIALFRRHERNGFLRIAFSYIQGGSTSGRLTRFREEIIEFEKKKYWERYRDSKEPPEDLLGSGLLLALFKGRQFGRIPLSIRQLWEIVEERDQ